MWAALRALLRPRPPVEAPAAPASAPVVIPPRRAQGPALRVHLCVACARNPVPYAGDVCSPCMSSLSPIGRAEQLTREAAE